MLEAISSRSTGLDRVPVPPSRSMLTARRTLVLVTTCLCVLLGLSVASATDFDANAKIPHGSYQLTCLILDVSGNNLRAICQALNGDWMTTELHNPDHC